MSVDKSNNNKQQTAITTTKQNKTKLSFVYQSINGYYYFSTPTPILYLPLSSIGALVYISNFLRQIDIFNLHVNCDGRRKIDRNWSNTEIDRSINQLDDDVDGSAVTLSNVCRLFVFLKCRKLTTTDYTFVICLLYLKKK